MLRIDAALVGMLMGFALAFKFLVLGYPEHISVIIVQGALPA
jgi:hypothetical protein